MSRGTRVTLAIALLAIGVSALLPFGGTIPMCLGPLGVTAVQYWAADAAWRPRTIEGPGSTGAWFVVHLPLDVNALLACGIAGAIAGAILTGRVAALPRRVRETD